jgi:phenylalanyl-tRNA synthetase alpha chain
MNMSELKIMKEKALDEVGKATLEKIESVRLTYLGRKGLLTEVLKGLGALPADERREIGNLANSVRKELEGALATRLALLERDALAERLAEEVIDITLPGRRVGLGSQHVISQIIREIEDIFTGLGYGIVDTREIETEYYNFTALNTPEFHPARTLQGTFYIDAPAIDERQGQMLLRTQTSPAQIRVMEEQEPPVFVIVPGKVYRPDVPDATHSPMFHQVEGLAVAAGITFADLKGTLEHFCHKMFGPDRAVRLRPHFFPFTEPSTEVDVQCIRCAGAGCRICSNTGWLEIMGAGMVDPNVFEMVGYDPDKISGFAFGMGPDRIAMLKYDISDIRMLFENDIRFLEQFAFRQ